MVTILEPKIPNHHRIYLILYIFRKVFYNRHFYYANYCAVVRIIKVCIIIITPQHCSVFQKWSNCKERYKRVTTVLSLSFLWMHTLVFLDFRHETEVSGYNHTLAIWPPYKAAIVPCWTGAWMGPVASLEAVVKRKTFTPATAVSVCPAHGLVAILLRCWLTDLLDLHRSTHATVTWPKRIHTIKYLRPIDLQVFVSAPKPECLCMFIFCNFFSQDGDRQMNKKEKHDLFHFHKYSSFILHYGMQW